MKKKLLTSIVAIALLAFTAVSAYARSDKAASRVANAIWANGQIYDVVVTTNSFKQVSPGTFDLLYNFSMSGLDGQRSISDAAPGYGHYNGGRWWVQMVVFTEAGIAVHDPDGDGIVNFELTDADMVLHHEALGHLAIMSTDVYFSCPLAGKGK